MDHDSDKYFIVQTNAQDTKTSFRIPIGLLNLTGIVRFVSSTEGEIAKLTGKSKKINLCQSFGDLSL